MKQLFSKISRRFYNASATCRSKGITCHYALLISLFYLFPSSVQAEPWLTGPILAPAGHTVPGGHTNFEFYALSVNSNGIFNGSGDFVRAPLFRAFVLNPILTHGFTDWLDVQLTLPYTFDSTQGVNSNRLADTTVSLGFQLLEQKNRPGKVDLRLLLQETFPTGRYDRLNPLALGTDSTGLGSYQTQLGLDFQYLSELFPSHYLRTRLILSTLFASDVQIHGLSSYGGTTTTRGTIKGGNESTIDLAFEYTLTQNWVAVMEGYATSGDATRFDGSVEIGNLGSPTAQIGNGNYSQIGLAPAIEYNFNANVGLIGGVWFPIQGSNTSHFMTYVLALNSFW